MGAQNVSVSSSLTLILFVFGLVAAVLLLFAQSGSFLLLALLVLFPLGVWLVSRPAMVLALGIAFYNSDIILLSRQLTLAEGMFTMFALTMLAAAIIHKEQRVRINWSERLALAYGAILVMLIVARGSGFRLLGSSKWGGMVYVTHFALVAFFFFSRRFELSAKQLKVALLFMVLLAGISPIVDFLFIKTGGKLSMMYSFFRTVQFEALAEGMSAYRYGGVFRLFSAVSLGQLLPMLTLVLLGAGKIRWPLALLLWCFSLFLILISGYRSSVIILGLFTLMYIFCGRWQAKWRWYFMLGGLTLLGYVGVIIFARDMPLTVQRIVSFLPLVEVKSEALASAVGTLEWRQELWKRAVLDIPRYFWMGKGFVFDSAEFDRILATVHWWADNIEYQIWTRNYHNSMLSLMLDLGAFGAVTVVALIISIAVLMMRQLRRPWHDPLLYRCAVGVAAYNFTVILLFLTSIYGDVKTVPLFMFYAGIINLLVQADERAAPEPDEEATPPIAPPARASRPPAPDPTPAPS